MPRPAPLLLETTLTLGGETVTCRVVRGQGRRLVVGVAPHRAVELRVPRGTRLADALAWLSTRQDWLERAWARAALRPAPLRFAAGEVHHVRGVPLRLRLRRGAPAVSLEPGALVVQHPMPNDPTTVEGVLRAWYRALAHEEVPGRVRALATLVPGRPAPAALRMRLMRRHWGSCRRDGVITLSTLLARAAPAQVDYVIVHELCHLRHFDHGPAFHSLVGRVLPDWRERRQALEALPAWPARELLAAA